jgi:hypothetical protein
MICCRSIGDALGKRIRNARQNTLETRPHGFLKPFVASLVNKVRAAAPNGEA